MSVLIHIRLNFAGTPVAPFLTDAAKLIDSAKTFIFDCDGFDFLFPSVSSSFLPGFLSARFALVIRIDQLINC
jgi:hypothetical protein